MTKLIKDMTEDEQRAIGKDLAQDIQGNWLDIMYMSENWEYAVATDGKFDRYGTALNKYVTLMEGKKTAEAYHTYKTELEAR